MLGLLMHSFERSSRITVYLQSGKNNTGGFFFVCLNLRSQNFRQWFVKIPTQFLKVLSSVLWAQM